MISSGALPKVALRKPPIPGPVWCGRLLGRFADQPGEWDERERGEDELGGFAEIGRVVEDDRDRGKGKRAPEDPPGHPTSLPAC